MNKEFDIRMVKKHLLEYSKICQAHSESLNENTVLEKIVALSLLRAGISGLLDKLQDIHEQEIKQHNG